MNRNYYCKVNSQEEVDELLSKLKDIGELILRSFTYNGIDGYYYIGYFDNKWRLVNTLRLSKIPKKVPASELIDYVTGKKVDKDALLEEAKRRYPVGTKFKSALKGDKHPFQTIVKENIYLDKVNGRQVIWNGDGCGFIYDDGNWAEIIEEPKVEIKEEFVLPEYWFLRFKTKEVFDELCKKYAPDFIFFENAGICNNPTKLKLGNYYYLTKDTKYGEEITFDQFKKYVLKENIKKEANLKIEDLVEGEIYYCETNISKELKQWVYKYLTSTINPTNCTHAARINGSYYDKNSSTICAIDHVKNLRLATSSEKKWLKTCIKQDKFIEQSELDKYDDEGNLMESKEYPEYYECIKPELWENTIKSNNGNLIFSGNFITKTGNTIEHEHLHQYGHFKISTKSAYDAQFKKDEKFKDGDWLVYIKDCGLKPSCPIKIGDIKQMLNGSFGTLAIYGYEDLSHCFRKALPHEIPVENSINQYPYTPEESIKLDFEIKWKEPRYIGGVDSITATGWGIYEQMKKQPIQSRKTPDLIDKSKVEVKIKRTKVKQIKL